MSMPAEHVTTHVSTETAEDVLRERFTAAVITDDGEEMRITDEMIQQACETFDSNFPSYFLTRSLQSKG